jgi:hypothetical protein
MREKDIKIIELGKEVEKLKADLEMMKKLIFKSKKKKNEENNNELESNK